MRKAAVLIAILAATQAHAIANGKDSDQPIDITSDHAEYDKGANTVLYTGNVIVIQGGSRLRCDWLKAFIRNNQDKAAVKTASASSEGPAASIYKIDAKGAVFLSNPDETASGDTATYDVPNKKITMRGKVILTRAQNVMEGSTLVVDTETGNSTLDPDKQVPSRVKGRFIPESKPSAETKPKAAQ